MILAKERGERGFIPGDDTIDPYRLVIDPLWFHSEWMGSRSAYDSALSNASMSWSLL